MADKKNLLLLFERPGEPVMSPKGKENNTIFKVPDSFLEERYKELANDVSFRVDDDETVQIDVQDCDFPDLSEISKLDKQENFSLFLPLHRKCATELTDIFLKATDINQLQSYAVYARDRVNSQLFNYSLSVALLHRKDTKDGLALPLFVESFPSKFVDSKFIAQAKQEASLFKEKSRKPILIPKDFSASDLEPEHALWYFREDLGVNLHHWHWHLVYPVDAADEKIVAKDRRGELFYYMHQQILARYNFERLCNNLPRLVSLTDLRAPIPEGYFPKLDTLVASRSWPGRSSNVKLYDINRKRDLIDFKISTVELWIARIKEAIANGYAVTKDGQHKILDEVTGIDTVGNMCEASIRLSPNASFYGDLHNMGHTLLSYQHDPDLRHLESYGVMGDVATAVRDPVFYRWHSVIDDLCEEHKKRLTPYTEQQLTYPGIKVEKIEVISLNQKTTKFNTFWEQSDINLAKGMDFLPHGDVFARFTHLQHIPFIFQLSVLNESDETKFGMARVFMAPKYDDSGNPWTFNGQRRFWIELDKFVVQLIPGLNTIKRRSKESTVTILSPYLNASRKKSGDADEFNFCGCGWPHHLLIPRGSPEGFASELFVMISNHEEDKVDQSLSGKCNEAASFCGLRDRLYPDRRAMGYPFDRLSRENVEDLNQFMTPNMGKADVSIIFNDEVVPNAVSG